MPLSAHARMALSHRRLRRVATAITAAASFAAYPVATPWEVLLPLSLLVSAAVLVAGRRAAARTRHRLFDMRSQWGTLDQQWRDLARRRTRADLACTTCWDHDRAVLQSRIVQLRPHVAQALADAKAMGVAGRGT